MDIYSLVHENTHTVHVDQAPIARELITQLVLANVGCYMHGAQTHIAAILMQPEASADTLLGLGELYEACSLPVPESIHHVRVSAIGKDKLSVSVGLLAGKTGTQFYIEHTAGFYQRYIDQCPRSVKAIAEGIFASGASDTLLFFKRADLDAYVEGWSK